MGYKNKYEEVLKKNNLKMTRHRHAVLEVLDGNSLPLSAEELYIKLKEKGVSMSFSTVYRVLEAFLEKGIVVRNNLPDDGKSVYEIYCCDNHHHYLLCIDCRKVVQVEGCPLEEYERAIEEKFAFIVKGHNLEVYGYCSDCKVP